MPAHSARRRATWVVGLALSSSAVLGLQAVHGVAHADQINPATGCGEDSFLAGGASPDPGAVVTVPNGGSQTFSVVYHDETAINTNSGFTPLYTVTGPAGNVVQSGAPATGGASAPAGTHDKFNTLLSVAYAPPADGKIYTLKIKAWDGDQNKAGGDCGAASWQVTTPAPPTTTTTIPHQSTTTTVPQTTTTTAPSTPQTNVLGETFAQAPPAAAVVGTPALTG